jgi:hypothetical protein
MRKTRKKMLYYLKKVFHLEQCDQARRVADNILKSFDMMWLFVKDTEIEPTNNFAERQIKHHVKYRKNSLFTWSDRGGTDSLSGPSQSMLPQSCTRLTLLVKS